MNGVSSVVIVVAAATGNQMLILPALHMQFQPFAVAPLIYAYASKPLDKDTYVFTTP